MQPTSDRRISKDRPKKKEWSKPLFRNLRLGFEITMYFWTR